MADPTYKDLSRIKDNTNNVIYLIKALALAAARNMALSGDITGSASTDLSGDVTIPSTIAANAVTESKVATDAVTTDKIKDLNITFGKLAAAVYGGSIAEGTADKLATKVQVKQYVESVISGQGTYRGSQTVATINGWTLANLNNGDRVNVSDSGTVTIDGNSLPVRAGEDLTLWKYVDNGVTHGIWQSHDGEFKLLQTAVDEAGGVGMTLTRIQQDANGDIVATFAQIAITSAQISDKMSTYDGTGSNKTKVVTGEAVKAAIDSLDATKTSTDGTNVQVKVTEVNGKITAVNITNDDTENRNNKTSTIRDASSADNTKYPTEKAVRTAIDAIDAGASVMGEVVAAALVDLDSRIQDVADAAGDINLGTRTADSIDAQTLLVGGENIRDLLDEKVDKVEGKGLSSNDFTDTLKSKLDNIASGAEVNVQADWNETNSSSDAYVKNKPENLVQDADYVHTDNNFTDTLKNKLNGIASGAEVNVQSDWGETNTGSDAYVKNKPANLVQDAGYVHTDNNFTDTLKNKLDAIESGAEVNAIETVKVNGTALTPDSSRAVNVPAANTSTYGVVEYMTSSEATALWTAAWNAAT